MITQQRYFGTSKYKTFSGKRKNLYFITLFVTLKKQNKIKFMLILHFHIL